MARLKAVVVYFVHGLLQLALCQLQDNTWRRMVQVPSSTKQKILSYEKTMPNAFVSLWPCFGDMNLYIKESSLPDFDQDDPLWESSENTIPSWTQRSTLSEIVYIGVEGLVDYEIFDNISAIFDVVASYSSEEVDNLIPVPGESGKVKATLGIGGNTATLKWTTSDGPDDYYIVYRKDYEAGVIPDDMFYTTACGYEMWMDEYATNNDIEFEDGQASLYMTDMDRSIATVLTVIVYRPEGYEAPYYSLTINGAVLCRPLMLSFLLAFLVR